MLDDDIEKLAVVWRDSPQCMANDLMQMLEWIETKVVKGSATDGYRVRSDDALKVAQHTLEKVADAAEAVVRHRTDYGYDHEVIRRFQRELWKQRSLAACWTMLKIEVERFVNWVQLLPDPESESLAVVPLSTADANPQQYLRIIQLKQGIANSKTVEQKAKFVAAYVKITGESERMKIARELDVGYKTLCRWISNTRSLEAELESAKTTQPMSPRKIPHGTKSRSGDIEATLDSQ